MDVRNPDDQATVCDDQFAVMDELRWSDAMYVHNKPSVYLKSFRKRRKKRVKHNIT